MKNTELLELSQNMKLSALNVLNSLDVVNICHSAGAAVNIVGSFKTGLMLNHRDIDLHIYTDEPMIEKSFSVMKEIAGKKGLRDVQYKNLLDTKEDCIEWHLWYEDETGITWKLDIIHIRKGSFYEGFFEKVSERIIERLTPETKEVILQIKYELGEESKVPGIQIYHAVLEHGINNYVDFIQWSEKNPVDAILEWTP